MEGGREGGTLPGGVFSSLEHSEGEGRYNESTSPWQPTCAVSPPRPWSV